MIGDPTEMIVRWGIVTQFRLVILVVLDEPGN